MSEKQQTGITVDINLRAIDLHAAIMYLEDSGRDALLKAEDDENRMSAILMLSALQDLHGIVDDLLASEDALQLLMTQEVQLDADGHMPMNDGEDMADES